jgi:hypothetical protein
VSRRYFSPVRLLRGVDNPHAQIAFWQQLAGQSDIQFPLLGRQNQPFAPGALIHQASLNLNEA